MMRARSCKAYPKDAKCSVEGCINRPRVNMLCGTHYSRIQRNGTVNLMAPKKAPYAAAPDVELALAAGLMEGEGSVRINAITRMNKGALIVTMTNTNEELIAWMNNRWPGYCKLVAANSPRHKQPWKWTIAANAALSFLNAIFPFVVSTRMKNRIEAARWWQEIKSKLWQKRTEDDYEESFSCWHWMSHLNRRGVAA